MIGIVGITLGICFVLFLLAGIRIVRPVEKGLIETLGKYSTIKEDGFSWIIPIIQRMIKVNTTEIRVDVEPQNIITKDKLNATVDAVVYYKIKEVNKAIYNVNNYSTSVPSLARTTLRAVIGKMTLSDANENRDRINTDVENQLDQQTNAWGIDIIRVELQKIEPPQDVQDAMNEVVKAENDKIAAKDFATAVETKADGERRAEIKKAEGKAKGIELVANAQAKEIEVIAKADAEKIKVINESAEKYFKGNAKELKKLEVTQKSLEKNAKVILTEKGITPQLIIGELPMTK